MLQKRPINLRSLLIVATPLAVFSSATEQSPRQGSHDDVASKNCRSLLQKSPIKKIICCKRDLSHDDVASYSAAARLQLPPEEDPLSHQLSSPSFFKRFDSATRISKMGWLWLVGSIKLQVSFAKQPYKRDDILQKRPINSSILLTVVTPYR